MSKRVFFFARNARYATTLNAEEFGEVRYLFSHSIPSPFNAEFVNIVDECLVHHNFDPENDYIALTGSQLNVAMLLGCVMGFFGKANVLLFDAVRSTYVESKLVCPEE